MSELSLVEICDCDQFDLFAKFTSYKALRDAGQNIPAIIHQLFDIPLDNKKAIFFIACGLKVLESEVEYFREMGAVDA